jgi:uncharacterized membrane protein
MARSALHIGLVVLLTILVLYSLPPALISLPRVRASSRTITLTAYINTGWNGSQSSGPNPMITVTQGESITFQLYSGDGAGHQFYVDYNGNGVPNCGVPDYCSPLFTSSTTTTLDTSYYPGTYNYYDSQFANGHGLYKIRPTTRDYEIAVNPASLTIAQNSNANSTITVTSINNYSGTITLSLAGTPTGFHPSFSMNPVIITSNGTATSKLTLAVDTTAVLGAHTINVYASNTTSSHYTSIVATVVTPPIPDFTISCNPTTLTTTVGSQTNATVTLSSQAGFAGILTLTSTISPTGPTTALSSSTLTITSGGSSTTTLTDTTTSTTQPGNYTITLSITNGTTTHTKNEPLTVTPPTKPPSGSGTITIIIVTGAFLAAISAIGAAAYILRRKHVRK